MLGYTTRGDWTIGHSKEIEEDPVITKEPYKLNLYWAKPMMAIEKRLVRKHVEGITIHFVHLKLTKCTI